MAQIVLGLGTSHTPQLSTTPDIWDDHRNRDRRNPLLLGRDGNYHTYDEILEHPEWVVDDSRLTMEVWQAAHKRTQEAIAALAAELQRVAPDVVVVVGDDQEELFRNDGMPTFAVYWGDGIAEFAPDAAEQQAMPLGLRAALWAAHGETPETYPVPSQLGRHIVEQLMLDEFDVMQLSEQPEGRSIGHAYTFVRRRLMGATAIPLLPVAINAYNPPNQPTARRCFMFGRALRKAIDSYPQNLRVAVVASGGLSHFVVDEELDQRVIEAMQKNDADALMNLPRQYLRSGTSEILNWVGAAGALEHLSMRLVDYVPGYRSEAGTGVGMTFAIWE